MPYKGIGGLKNASKEAAINLEIADDRAKIGVYVSSSRRVRVQVLAAGDPLFDQPVDLTPETAFIQSVGLPAGLPAQAITLRVLDGQRELIAFTPLPDSSQPIPKPARAAKPPAEIESNEELFFVGLHLEQYHHATYDPESYYLEALRRDPLDSRCNNALGRLLLRRGKFAEAEAYFRTACASITGRNPNPYDGEAFYNLGLILKEQGCYDEAVDAFYKTIWNAAWQDSAYFELALLACRSGRLDEALERVERSLERNQQHHKARHLRIIVLRRLGRLAEAEAEVHTCLVLDRLNFGALYEQFLLTGDAAYRALMGGIDHNYLELSLDYAHAGFFEEAAAVLSEVSSNDPMLKYYLGWHSLQRADLPAAQAAFAEAERLPPDYCFPNHLECVAALQNAIEHNPRDARAPYYLGNFWYAHRRYQDAVACWQRARDLDPDFPTVQRNLGLAYVNKLGDLQQGLVAYQRAFELNPHDARVFFELDQLSRKLNVPAEERLAHFARYANLVEQRDDLTIERVTLLNLLGRHDEALAILLTHSFHPWEGGEGKVTGQYVICRIELAKRCLQVSDFAGAMIHLEAAQTYPRNLGEGKLYNAQENNVHYYLGCACEGLGDAERARACFARAAVGLSEPTSPMFYNDQPPDMIFYQGKAHQKLGQLEAARVVFQRLIDYGTEHLEDHVTIDYFAVSLPDFLVFDEDLDQRNRVHCHYMIALGCLGLDDQARAAEHFDALTLLDAAHLGAAIHRALLTVPGDPSA